MASYASSIDVNFKTDNYPYKIDIEEYMSSDINNNNRVIKLKNIKSGSELPMMQFYMIDDYGHFPAQLAEDMLHISLHSKDNLFVGEIMMQMKKEMMNRKGIMVYGSPGEKELSINFNIGHFKNIKLIIELRNCTIGEEVLGSGTLCNPCESLSYNFNPIMDDRCKPCPKYGKCDGIGIYPNKGYWHLHPCSDVIHKCITEKACFYLNRQNKLFQYNQNINSCNFTKDEIFTYQNILCQKVSNVILI